MYSIGLPAAIEAFHTADWPSLILIAICILVLILGICKTVATEDYDDHSHEPTVLPSSSFSTIRAFYNRRFDFLQWGFRVTGSSVYQFNLLQNKVIAVSGDAGRKAFFSAKGFDLNQGFKTLAGAIPILAGVTSDLGTRSITLIHKRLGGVQTHENLSHLMSVFFEDTRKVMTGWGAAGTCDPFDRIHELIFQLTVRALSCAEIADDADTVARLKSLYDTLDRGYTPAAVLAPWLPSPAILRNTWTTKRIHDIIVTAIENRKKSGKSGNDTLQMLLDQNTEPRLIVGFMLGLIVAGSRSTGTTASWMLTFIGSHREWRDRSRAELEALLTSHGSASTDAPISEQLASIPLDAWEQHTPVLDSIIRETLRLAQPHVAMRRNLGPDVYIDGNIIPTGSYIVYPYSDVHLNPEIYPEPLRFDPTRRLETKETSYAYVGFGGGSTICAGQRLARLMIKVTTAMLLLGFDYGIVDNAGQPVQPQPDWNDYLTCRPSESECNLAFARSKHAL